MTKTDRQLALTGGIGAGVGTGTAAVVDRFFAMSFLVGMATAVAVGVVVAVGLLVAPRN